MKKSRLAPPLRHAALAIAGALSLAAAVPAEEAAAPARAFELRVYTAEKGKLEALEQRFRDHTVRLFRKHGMEVVGFWKPVPAEGEPDTLIYLLAFPNHEARDAAWSSFGNDPEWQEVARESQRDGRLVKKIESTRLDPADYSPLR